MIPATPNPTPQWRTLLDAALANNPSPHSAFAQLATVAAGTQGHETRPAVRTVTARFFLDDGRLLLTTDTRNEKVEDLTAYPACELCWYFTDTREQFRFSARGQVISSDEARKEAKLEAAMHRTWAERSDASRASFTWPQPKRKREAAQLFAAASTLEPPANFALLLLDIRAVDYLNIAHQPHERTQFTRLGGQWMALAVNP